MTWLATAASGLTRYIEEIRRVPMLEPQDEYVLAKRWREHGDRDAAHKLVNSHLRLVAKIAMGYRGYGLPISEVISEGNVGLMQGVKRFEPEKGFRLATYAMWWIKAAIQEYILRSWSLVKMGTTANQKKLFFNLRKAKSKISVLDGGDLRPDQVKLIAKRLGVTEQDVVDMNRRLGGDVSLNAPIRDDGDSGEWQDWLVDEVSDQETRLVEDEESDNRRKALGEALSVLNERERRIFEARRLADDPITLEDLAAEFGVSRERARQIEVRAFEKVQKSVKNGGCDGNSGASAGALASNPLQWWENCLWTCRHVVRQPDDAKGIPLVDQRTEICVVRETEMIADPKRKPRQDDGDSDKRRRQEEALDEALENTFPASDPVSVEQPTTSGRACRS
jgi:RNA polymerase sigma-32 factor